MYYSVSYSIVEETSIWQMKQEQNMKLLNNMYGVKYIIFIKQTVFQHKNRILVNKFKKYIY